LSGNRLRARLPGQCRDSTAPHCNPARGLKPLADQTRQNAAQALFPFPGQMLGDPQYVFIEIDGRPHYFSLPGLMR
jgi:hypothetical protein